MQPIKRIENLNISDDGSQLVTVAELTKVAINTESSPKAAFRKFRAENNLHPLAMPDDLLDLYIKYGNNPDGIPALHAAIKAGDEQAVRLFLDHGASPNSQVTTQQGFDGLPNTALEYATKYGQLNMLKLLLERGADLQRKFPYQPLEVNPILFAAQNNQPEIIKFLVEKGAKIMSCSEEMRFYNFDPIYCAIQSGSVDALKTLLDLGGKLDNPRLASYCDLLQTAVYSGKIEMVKFLLDRNVPIDHATFIYGASAISAAIAMKNIEMTKLLIAHGAKIQDDAWSSACQSDEPTLIEFLLKSSPASVDINEKLFISVRYGKINAAKYLIAVGADVNARENKSREPLIFLAVQHPEILQLLISKGANINPSFDGGNTTLHIAAQNNIPESIHILMRAGARINEKNTEGFTPLLLAACSNKEENVLALLERGANPNIADRNGQTPLFYIINNNNIALSTIKMMIKCGALVNACNVAGVSPLSRALNRTNIEIVEYLVNEAGANVNSKDSNGWTPLLISVWSGNFNVLELLIKKGADINAKNNGGETALSISRQHHQELVEWLIAHGARV